MAKFIDILPDDIPKKYKRRLQNFLRAKILMEKHGIEVNGMYEVRNWDLFSYVE